MKFSLTKCSSRNLTNQEQFSMLRSRFTNAICCLKILFSFEPCSDEGSFLIRFKNKFILDAVKSRFVAFRIQFIVTNFVRA